MKKILTIFTVAGLSLISAISYSDQNFYDDYAKQLNEDYFSEAQKDYLEAKEVLGDDTLKIKSIVERKLERKIFNKLAEHLLQVVIVDDRSSYYRTLVSTFGESLENSRDNIQLYSVSSSGDLVRPESSDEGLLLAIIDEKNSIDKQYIPMFLEVLEKTQFVIDDKNKAQEIIELYIKALIDLRMKIYDVNFENFISVGVISEVSWEEPERIAPENLEKQNSTIL